MKVRWLRRRMRRLPCRSTWVSPRGTARMRGRSKGSASKASAAGLVPVMCPSKSMSTTPMGEAWNRRSKKWFFSLSCRRSSRSWSIIRLKSVTIRLAHGLDTGASLLANSCSCSRSTPRAMVRMGRTAYHHSSTTTTATNAATSSHPVYAEIVIMAAVSGVSPYAGRATGAICPAPERPA